jgi:hypothetical protein
MSASLQKGEDKKGLKVATVQRPQCIFFALIDFPVISVLVGMAVASRVARSGEFSPIR